MHPIAKRFAKPFYINVNLKHFIQFIYFFFFLFFHCCNWLPLLLVLVLLLYDFFLFSFDLIWFDCIQTIYLLTLIVHCRFMIIDKIYCVRVLRVRLLSKKIFSNKHTCTHSHALAHKQKHNALKHCATQIECSELNYT